MLSQNAKFVKIILTGGGTGGSVAPLLAIAEALQITNDKLPMTNFLWLGTRTGPEREMVEREKMEFIAIPCGKLRRYWSWRNLTDPFLALTGFVRSLAIIRKWRPDLVISAGGFVSVPVVWAAWLLRVPVLIHQQDVRPGLANKLMASCAKVVTVTFEKSLSDYGKKAVCIGNFIRREFTEYKIDKKGAKQKLGLKESWPTVLVLGGGTGAAAINELVRQSLGELTKFCQIIHITGRGKGGAVEGDAPNYHAHEFLHVDGMVKAYTAADLVVSRCGMSILTELSYLAKPSILVPMPDSHQEDNAALFFENNAAAVADQRELTPEKLVAVIARLLKDEKLRNEIGNNMGKMIKRGANEKIAEIILNLVR